MRFQRIRSLGLEVGVCFFKSPFVWGVTFYYGHGALVIWLTKWRQPRPKRVLKEAGVER